MALAICFAYRIVQKVILYAQKPKKEDLMNEPCTWWEKFFIKYFDAVIVRDVSDATSIKSGESVMALHFCAVCKDYRAATYFDPMSRQDRIMCIECHERKPVKGVLGISTFRILECFKTARRVHETRKKKKRWSSETLLFLKFFFFGLGKETPCDRNGKTISDLENEARDLFLSSLCLYHETHAD